LGIILSGRTVKHIVERHPEVKPYINRIREAVENPDTIVKGFKGEFKALKWYGDLHLGPKYLVVVFRKPSEKEKIILTAHFTSSVSKVKGEVVWRRQP